MLSFEVTFPLDITKTRLQIQGERASCLSTTTARSLPYRGMIKTAVGIGIKSGFVNVKIIFWKTSLLPLPFNSFYFYFFFWKYYWRCSTFMARSSWLVKNNFYFTSNCDKTYKRWGYLSLICFFKSPLS